MFLKIICGIVLLVLILIVLFFTIFVDSKLIFWYLINKNTFKNKVIMKYVKDEKEVVFLGTVHDLHFTFEQYGFHHLKAVVKNYKPDVLLVESRQSELEIGNYADGPIEMFYLSMIARKLGIPVFGIDWYDHNSHKPGTTNKLRDNHIFENIVNRIDDYSKPLVIIGATHLLAGNSILKNKGFKKVKHDMTFTKNVYETTNESLVFDKDTIQYVQKRIEREKELLLNPSLDDNWRRATEIQITNLNNFIKSIQDGKFKLDT
jgi:hypothetical protein